MTQTESPFIESLLATEAEAFDRPIEQLCENRPMPELLQDCAALEAFWQATDNLYLRVRALAYLHYLHRFTLPALVEAGAAAAQWPPELLAPGPIPLAAHRALQARNFAEAFELLLREGTKARLNLTLSSGLATAYQSLALQNLAPATRSAPRGHAWSLPWLTSWRPTTASAGSRPCALVSARGSPPSSNGRNRATISVKWRMQRK